jgi:hypothetical protein
MVRNHFCVADRMLKRLVSRSSRLTASRSLIRLALVEALQAPECALCHLAWHQSQRYVDTLLNEAITDVDQRDAWRRARGLCSWHAWMATQTPHSAGSLAILYADVLHHDVTRLAALATPEPVAPGRPWRRWRRLAKRRQDWLATWQYSQPCPVCRLWLEQERLYIDVLLDTWHEPELAPAFAASRGLCWPHTLRLVEQGASHAHLPAVLTAQLACLQALQHELQEFIRRLDYRFAHQPYGRAADAWRRAMALYVGAHGGPGNTRPSTPTSEDG